MTAERGPTAPVEVAEEVRRALGPAGVERAVEHVPHRRVPLKGHPALNERWVQQLLAGDPSLRPSMRSCSRS